ncbi:MAG: hypothetical protein AUK63_1982 [bacterium P3]|nr:MAG: hypothetical protein AUK63_1982 [bacterium P3]KWW34142.1 MAG: hypothetical protein F083_2479 [bacterium F083]
MPAEKNSTTYSIPLNRDEIDILAKEIGIAHNCVVFSLYQNPDIEGMGATALCHYIHEFLVEKSAEMGLRMLPDYMSAADSLVEVMNEMYFNIGNLIENEGSEWHLPDNVDQALIMRSMEEYYNFVSEAFMRSDTYDEFEAACMNRLRELCSLTTTIDDYFYMSACGNITFASYCAWVTIFSGFNNTNTKGIFKDGLDYLRNKFKAVKEFVTEAIVKPIANIVRADFCGGAIGGSVGIGGAGIGVVIYGVSGLGAMGIFAGCWAVGAAAGSIIYANN